MSDLSFIKRAQDAKAQITDALAKPPSIPPMGARPPQGPVGAPPMALQPQQGNLAARPMPAPALAAGATQAAPQATPRAFAKGGSVSPLAAKKVGKVMGEFTSGKLHSGSKSGPKVKNRKQAIAIALSEARKKGNSS